MKDRVAVGGRPRDVAVIADIALGDREAWVTGSVSEVGPVPGAEVVQDGNLPALVEEAVNEVASYEA
jgi:hypothetical protein